MSKRNREDAPARAPAPSMKRFRSNVPPDQVDIEGLRVLARQKLKEISPKWGIALESALNEKYFVPAQRELE